MSLCLAGGALVARIAVTAFTLAWTHTVEKTEWREAWTVAADGLVLVTAEVRGSGAGMEPPDGARLVEGRYVWQPLQSPLPELVLRRAPGAGDWTLCAGGRCAAVGDWLGADADPVRLAPCGDGARRGAAP